MPRTCLAAVLAAVILPCTAMAQPSANDIVKTTAKSRSDALDGIHDVTIDQTMGGVRNFVYMETRAVDTVEGQMRMLVAMSIFDPQNPGGQPNTMSMSPSDLRKFSAATMATGMMISEEIKAQNPFPIGTEELEAERLATEPDSGTWVSADPATMMMGNALFLEGAANAMESNAAEDGVADANTQARDMASFADVAELVGQETVDGRPAFHLRAPVNRTERQDGREFTMKTMDVWIDTERYVQLKMELGGIVTEDGKSQPMTIERHDSDYRKAPGTDLYLPYSSVMRIGGMMTPEQQAQMQEAQKQMAQFEQQMKDMPAAQRDMVMRQMGPQMEQMKEMSSGGAFETETVVHEIRVNAGRPQPTEVASKTLGAPVAAGDDLTKRIQQDLVTLGYNPGDVNGELTTETVIAISQFQAERDMPVTGEVSPQLAGVMAAEISKQSGGGAAGPQAAAAASPPAPAQDPEALRAAQEACLQKKIQEAQEAQKKKRGFGRLLSAVTRTATRTGNYDLASTAGDVYSANATADDLAAAAKDLGLTEDEVAACQNPM